MNKSDTSVKKKIQKTRMMSYFIEAAQNIIEEEGLEQITIRKVSDLAGYNSATLYNYFENLDHLICFASMKYLKEYSQSLPSYIKGSRNSIEYFLNVWKAFCVYSFSKPKIFYTLFFDKFSHSLRDIVKEYYEIFPDELGDQTEDTLSKMLLKQTLLDRNKAILLRCVDEGYLRSEDLDDLNEMIIILYQGMLERVIKGHEASSIETSTEKLVHYIGRSIKAYQIGNSAEDILSQIFSANKTPARL